MSRPDSLYTWMSTVTTHLPGLSQPQATVLALWSFGMVVAGSCGLPTVASFLAGLLAKKDNTVRQQLREWYYDAADKRGPQRQSLDVTTCFLDLLRWILAWWPAEEKRLALALDATSLGDQFTVLVLSVLYRGCAIPVAWTVVAAAKPGAWKPYWLELLSQCEQAIPTTWKVIVLADRGLYARWLFREVQRLGWHPFFRINSGGKFRRPDATEWQALTTLTPAIGAQWCGEVICFKNLPLACTLLVRWDAPYTTPWLIVTDLTTEAANICWYALRAWIECAFKDTKRGGWHWQQTRITDPARATRFWLAIAVATLWVVSVGGEADATLPVSSLAELPAKHIARRRPQRRSQPRTLSCFRRGRLKVLACLLLGTPLPLGRFFPEPWPDSLLVKELTE